MHLAVDLDNTVLDATTTHLFYYNLASGQSFTPADVQNFYLYTLYGWSREEREHVYNQYGERIHRDSQPLPYAVETLQELYLQHQITIMTARPESFREVTASWLSDFSVPYNQLVFLENKLEQCKACQADVLIDDGPHYAEQFAQAQRPMILYDQPYNANVSSPWVHRAKDWKEVSQHLSRLNLHTA